MRIFLSVVVLVVIAVAVWFAMSSKENAGSSSGSAAVSPGATSAGNQEAGTEGGLPMTSMEPKAGQPGAENEEEEETADDRPATEVYKSAEEALKAVKEGAADYDDLVLDQFTDLPRNCSWCDNFYTSLRDMVVSPETKTDERSYYAELLAISGRIENVKALVDGINNAKNPEEANVYAEALELSTGAEEVVRYLGDQISSKNDSLREAAVAAVTNQGSRLAVETLYKNTMDRGDPDGYYSMGIGLGEVVPEPEALPYLQELAMKRDQYSHLAIKSLLNAGLDGTKIVVDVLSSSNNPEADRELLKGAKDHVAYDDDVVQFFNTIKDSSKSQAVREWARDVLADFAQSKDEEAPDGTTEDAAPLVPEQQ